MSAPCASNAINEFSRGRRPASPASDVIDTDLSSTSRGRPHRIVLFFLRTYRVGAADTRASILFLPSPLSSTHCRCRPPSVSVRLQLAPSLYHPCHPNSRSSARPLPPSAELRPQPPTSSYPPSCATAAATATADDAAPPAWPPRRVGRHSLSRPVLTGRSGR